MIVLDLGLPDLSGMDVIKGGACVLVDTDHRAVGTHRHQRQGDRARSRRRRLRDQAVQHRRAARAAARGDATIGAPRRSTSCRSVRPRVDLGAKTVTAADGSPVHLTPTEWHLLEALLRRPGKLVTGRSLLTELRGSPDHTDPSYLRIYIAALRRKLEPVPSRPRYLITEPGMGYRFEP